MRWLKKKPIRVSVPTFGLMLLAATPLFAQCPGGVCQMPAGYFTAPSASGTYRTVPAARPRVLMSPHRRAATPTTWATFVPSHSPPGGWVFVPVEVTPQTENASPQVMSVSPQSWNASPQPVIVSPQLWNVSHVWPAGEVITEQVYSTAPPVMQQRPAYRVVQPRRVVRFFGRGACPGGVCQQ